MSGKLNFSELRFREAATHFNNLGFLLVILRHHGYVIIVRSYQLVGLTFRYVF